jgi:hypothetical protein
MEAWRLKMEPWRLKMESGGSVVADYFEDEQNPDPHLNGKLDPDLH